jgi:hypothetical protein
MLKGCFYLFNIKKELNLKLFETEGWDSFSRQANANKSKAYLRNYLPELNSETIKIDSQETLEKFLLENIEFKVDPDGYDPENFEPIYLKDESSPLGWKYGQIGIWASNYMAWLNFLKTDFDYVMLVEDDVYFKEGSFEVFEECLRQLPDDWEIYHFCVPRQKRIMNQLTEVINSKISLPYINDSNACYIVNRAGVNKLLQQVSEGIFLPLDWHWFKQPLFNIYATRDDVETYCDLLRVKSTHWETQQFKKLS